MLANSDMARCFLVRLIPVPKLSKFRPPEMNGSTGPNEKTASAFVLSISSFVA